MYPLYSTAQNTLFHRLILAYLVQNRLDQRLPPVDRPRSPELGFRRRTRHLTPRQNQLNCPSPLATCRLEYPIDHKFDQTIFRCEYHTVMYARRLWHPLHVISYPLGSKPATNPQCQTGVRQLWPDRVRHQHCRAAMQLWFR